MATPFLQFKTRDPGEFVDRIGSMVPNIHVRPSHGRTIQMSVRAVDLPGMGLFSAKYTNFHVTSPERPVWAISTILSGQACFRVRGEPQLFDAGRTHVQHPNRPFDAWIRDGSVDCLILSFDAASMRDFARDLYGTELRDDHLGETLDPSDPKVASFLRHTRFMWDEFLRDGSSSRSELVARESVRLMQVLFLAAARADQDSADRVRNGDATRTRRAEEYLAAHLSEPVCLAEVARTAGMSIRTLSRLFRARHGTSVMGFLRDRRLDAIHQALLREETGQTNVTQAALAYGMPHLGRFAAAYRSRFGEAPSGTLARRRKPAVAG